MKQPIETIIFDLGGVLVDWNPAYVYRKVFNYDETKVDWFLKNVCTNEWNMEQDAGRTIKEAVALKVAEFPQYEALIKMYYKEWHNMFNGIIEENVNLFKSLKACGNYKIYALTNWSAETWPKALELFPFFNDFDGVIVSGKVKTRKPFPEIYQILFKTYQINPNKAIFIDDNKDNILTANKLKLHGIHLQNPQQLKQEFKRKQIIY